jgi:DNA-binding winged helix-turn-helix (wHTH) protein
MSSPVTSPRTIHFGEYSLDLETSELRTNGNTFLLQEQSFQVLRTLLERPGELVTREELKNKLWSDGTFVDFDHSLNKAVNRLRGALADSADAPRFIQTIPRRGYRFIGPVHLGGAIATQTTPSQDSMSSGISFPEKPVSRAFVRSHKTKLVEQLRFSLRSRRLAYFTDYGQLSIRVPCGKADLPSTLLTITYWQAQSLRTARHWLTLTRLASIFELSIRARFVASPSKGSFRRG